MFFFSVERDRKHKEQHIARISEAICSRQRWGDGVEKYNYKLSVQKGSLVTQQIS